MHQIKDVMELCCHLFKEYVIQINSMKYYICNSDEFEINVS